jgi:hypothetical protein
MSLMSLAASAVLATSPSPDVSGVVLHSNEGSTVELAKVLHENRLTAVVFYSSTCPCFASHRTRLGDLARELSARGVRFLLVDSERPQPGEPVPTSVEETGLIYRDDQGRLAHRLNARFATETFVFDSRGALRYRGGIDDDRRYLTGASKARLRDALLGLLGGTAPAFTTAKALGCALRLM